MTISRHHEAFLVPPDEDWRIRAVVNMFYRPNFLVLIYPKAKDLAGTATRQVEWLNLFWAVIPKAQSLRGHGNGHEYH